MGSCINLRVAAAGARDDNPAASESRACDAYVHMHRRRARLFLRKARRIGPIATTRCCAAGARLRATTAAEDLHNKRAADSLFRGLVFGGE